MVKPKWLSAVGGAVENFVKAVALEVAPKRINVVRPGIIETPMFGAASADHAARMAAITACHIIPRAGQPEEAAQAILFLCQNKFVTGTTVHVDGGWLLS